MTKLFVYEITNGQLYGSFDSVYVTHPTEQLLFHDLLLLAMVRTQENGEMFQNGWEPHMVLARYLENHFGFSIVEAEPHRVYDFKELQNQFDERFNREYDPFDFERIQKVSSKSARDMMAEIIRKEKLE